MAWSQCSIASYGFDVPFDPRIFLRYVVTNQERWVLGTELTQCTAISRRIWTRKADQFTMVANAATLHRCANRTASTKMVISLVLHALGIPVWIFFGMLLLILWNRKRVEEQSGTFPVKIRSEPTLDSEPATKWPRRASYAQCVHDA